MLGYVLGCMVAGRKRPRVCVCCGGGTAAVVLAEVRPSHVYCPSGSADAILALVNAGASVSAEDKDGLTGEALAPGALRC